MTRSETLSVAVKNGVTKLTVLISVPVLICALAAFGGSAVARASSRAPLGTNLSGLDDWSSEFAFLDAFKTSRPWFSGSRRVWQDTRSLDLDDRGWVRSLQPGQVARTLMFWGTNLQYPPGQYVVSYEGEGTIQYGGGARLVQSAPGSDVVNADPSRGGIGLFITSVNSANHIRDIHVRMPVSEPGAPSTEIFNPLFLGTIRSYKVVRFMNWMLGQNNNNLGLTQQHWQDRPTPEDARWNTRGAPVEVMVELANALGVNPWFNIPHLADDDYARHFAETVRDKLAPGLKVYVEHSNEVWNGQYPQAVYARQRGLALGLGRNPLQAQIRYHSLRSSQIFAIFEEVMGRERLVRVLASMAASPLVSQAALSFGDTAGHTDALAIAPYFGILPQDQWIVPGMSLDALMLRLQNVALPQMQAQVRQQAALAAQYGLPLVAYEGGQSLVASGALQQDPSVNALFDAANRDPRMGAIYTRYLQDWSDAGGSLLVHYTNCYRFGPFGRFGSLETLDQPRSRAPKYDALQRWIEGS